MPPAPSSYAYELSGLVLPHGVVVSLVLLPSDSIGSVGLVSKLCEVGKPASFGLCVCVCVEGAIP